MELDAADNELDHATRPQYNQNNQARANDGVDRSSPASASLSASANASDLNPSNRHQDGIVHSASKHTWPDESEVEQSSKRRKQSHKVVLPRPYSVAKFKLTLQKTSRNIRNPRSRSGSPAPATANASLQTKSKRQHIARWHTSGAITSKITSCPTARRERGLGRDRKHHRAFAPAAQARS